MESEHFKSAGLRCRHCGREGVMAAQWSRRNRSWKWSMADRMKFAVTLAQIGFERTELTEAKIRSVLAGEGISGSWGEQP